MSNYTIRPVLWVHKKNAEGRCPLKIAITVARKLTYIATPYRLKENQWDGAAIINYPNAHLVNVDLRKRISDLEKKITLATIEGMPLNGNLLRGTSERKSFIKYAREIKNSDKEINRLIAFAGSGLLLTAVDVKFLRKYEDYERARGMSQNTINLTFKYLRRIIRQAKAEKLIKENPFDDFKVPKYVQSERIYLVESEKKKLFTILNKPGLNSSLYQTLCYFLFGCYTGLRHSDWGGFRDGMVDNGFLKLRAKKNGKWVVLPIGPTLKDLIIRLKNLPPPISGQKMNVQLKALAALAKIDKAITSHSARHSFATMCASNKIPQSVTAELLGVDTKTVRVYYHLTGESIIEQASILTKL
jgi:integrase